MENFVNTTSFVKKYAAISLLLSSSHLMASDKMWGGQTAGMEYVAKYDSVEGMMVPEAHADYGSYASVALDDMRNGIAAGMANGAATAPFFIRTRDPFDVTGLPASPSHLNTAAISKDGVAAILGGQDNFGNGYAAWAAVPPGACVSCGSVAGPCMSCGAPVPVTEVVAVAAHDAGRAVIAGITNPPGWSVSTVQYPSITPAFVTGGLPVGGHPNDADMADRGRVVVGGVDGLGAAQVATLDFGSLTATLVPGLPATGEILAVAIDDAGRLLFGGRKDSNVPYLARFDGASLQDLSNIWRGPGLVNDVDLSSDGFGVAVGVGDQEAFAVTIDPDGVAFRLKTLGASVLTSAAINDAHAGIFGGQRGDAPFVAIFNAEGVVLPLILRLGPGIINSVDISNVLNHIPTKKLSGNNLKLAKYINKNASSSPLDLPFYFTQASMDGKLSQALESAAPTRNAFALIAASDNMFMLNRSVTNYSQEWRSKSRLAQAPVSVASLKNIPADELMASNSEVGYGRPWKREAPAQACYELSACNYELWTTALGALAYQKAQKQTPGFNPTTGAFILGFDGKTSDRSRVGVGVAYAYTHIHEKKDAGRSNINQEFLFTYGLWDSGSLYVDAALWGGLFQVSNLRKIDLINVEFKSKSHPKGWQLSPHFELGYDFNSCTKKTTYEPFVMFDWSNNWQGSYKESGSILSFGQKRHYSSFLRSELGTRFYQTVSYDTWNLVIEEKVSYVNKKPFNVGKVNSFIVGAPGSFTVETFTTTQNLGAAELSLIFESKKPCRPYSSIQYQGEFGSKYQLHQLALTVGWNF